MESDSDSAHRASEEEVTITRMLEKVLKRSDAVDREALCIVAGQRVRSVKSIFLPLASFSCVPCSCSFPRSYGLRCKEI